ncbi:hypothetical protein FSP39_011043 [Pinctada imbricata]|uniref:Cytochrome P450 n=1 Tax=Pinctada imbricata TaxID=66713 RepID=A0AA89BX14_PINIB|nr:hypothetical protein FSP39_011043 [Pinctada imbricata]
MNTIISIVLGIIAILVIVFVGFLIWISLERRKLNHLPGPKLSSFIFGTIEGIKDFIENGGSFAEYVTEMFMGEGLVTINDKKKWTWKRAILNPAFQKSHLRKLEDDFNEVSDSFMDRLEKLADGKRVVKMLDEFNHMALDMIAKVVYAVDLKSVDSDDNPFTRAINKSFEGFQKNAEDKFLKLKPWKWAYIKTVTDSIQFLRNYTREQMAKRMEAIAKGDHVQEDILSFILKLKESDPELSEEELLDEFMTFFVAGQETTGNLMAFMVMDLAQNPTVLSRLLREIDQVVGKKAVISYDDLNKLTYLDMVVKETLRLHPPVGQPSRVTTKPMEVAGYTIPAGTMVGVALFSIARSEEFFDDPLTYNPERFSPDAEKKVDTYTYFPFTLGPRTCIGRHFADIEAKTVMTKILQRYTFELVKDQPMGLLETITIGPKGRVQCILRIRED